MQLQADEFSVVWKKIIGVENDGLDYSRNVVLEEKNSILYKKMNADIS